jgi:hypothetical protein
VIATTENKPVTLKTIAHDINDYFWCRRQVSEGTTEPIAYEFTKRRIALAKDGLPWKNVWLIIRRSLADQPECSYYISNAPIGIRLKTFVRLSGVRWAIKQCFEETKTELGMDHYGVRKFSDWQHYMLTRMLAHFFLWQMKIRLGKKTPAITLSQLRVLLKVVLPMRVFDTKAAIDLVKWIQEKSHRPYLSHRKKKLENMLCFNK